ncbi:MAG: tRNA (adenosine(37)-N6)-threonylcarbamoyltransferase complex dimerization subunit type 1 TsaB [Clostridia bacterium]|nr:tRNA (adenosine(37)-N6)-threonylcarbamoyltransferase complex dimerization subunit type 1 TsaB [Clostridia bacterium]
MKNFLAVDTSNDYLTVLAVKDEKAHVVFMPDCAMKHSVSLMGAVDEALKKAGMTTADCEFFSAVVGAGSFTGIRIGISVAKGFCLAHEKPALPITSFDVIAYNAIDREKALCLVDALHDCYYVCGYQQGEIVYPPAYLTEEEVLELVKEGYSLYACKELPISQKAALTIVDPVSGLEKAAKALSEKQAFGELTALYVRKSSAEINAGK